MPDNLPQGFTLDETPGGVQAPGPAPAAPIASGDASNSPPPGFQLDEEKYGTLGQTALAGLEGGASGLTFGLSRAAETALLGNAAAQRGRIEANPIVSPVSTIGGAVLPIALTGGAAAPEEIAAQGGSLAAASRASLPYLAARAGKTIAQAAGEGVGGRALGFGAEGALYGAGNAVSDAALGDPHEMGQKVLADVGMGAAFGAGLGILSKGIEAALPAATKKLNGSLQNLKETVFGTEEAPSIVTRALSVPGGMVSGQEPTDWANSFFSGFNRVDEPLTIRDLTKNIQGIYDSSKQAATDLYETAAPANIGKALENMPVEQALTNAVPAVEQIAEQAQSLSPTSQQIVEDKLEALRPELRSAESAAEVHSTLDKLAKGVNKLIKFDMLPTASQMSDQDVLNGIRKTLQTNLKDEAAWGGAAQHYAQTNEEYSEYLSARKNFQSAFMRKEPSSKQYFVDPKKVESFFKGIGQVGQDVKSQYLNDFLNRTQSLAKASENYYGFQEAQKSISGRVSELAKKHLELTDIAKALQSRVENAPASGRLLEGGAALGAHALGVPSPIVGAALSAVEAYKAVKNPYQLGGTLSNTFTKLKALGDISETIGKKITQGSKSIFGVTEGRLLPAGSVSIPSGSSYDKRVSRIEQLASSPNILMDHLDKTTRGIYEAAPNVTEGVHSSIIAGIQFLNSKIPRPLNQMVLSPEWEASRAQKETFQNYYNAVDNPLSAFKEIKNGSLTSETMEALHAVYPQLLERMQASILETLGSEKTKNLGYGTKIALSKFLGKPLDEAMTPVVMNSNQIALTQGTPPAPQPKKAGKSTLGGLKELNVASRTRPGNQEDRDNET